MKRIALVIVFLIFLVADSLVYAGQFGPPEPVSKEGRLSLGIGYFYYSDRWEPKDSAWEKSKVTQNQEYLQLGYSFIKNWEAYLRVGGADQKMTDMFDTSTDSPDLAGFNATFKDGSKPFGTIGVRGVFNITPSLGIGPFFQGSFYSSYKDKTTGTFLGLSATQEMKVKKPREINLGVGFQSKIGKITLYGGPVAYWAKSRVDWEMIVPGVGTATASTTYKEKNNFGGFAGLRVPLGKAFTLEVEGQMKSELSGGASISYSF